MSNEKNTVNVTFEADLNLSAEEQIEALRKALEYAELERQADAFRSHLIGLDWARNAVVNYRIVELGKRGRNATGTTLSSRPRRYKELAGSARVHVWKMYRSHLTQLSLTVEQGDELIELHAKRHGVELGETLEQTIGNLGAYRDASFERADNWQDYADRIGDKGSEASLSVPGADPEAELDTSASIEAVESVEAKREAAKAEKRTKPKAAKSHTGGRIAAKKVAAAVASAKKR